MVQNTQLFDAVFHIVLCIMADNDAHKSSFMKNADRDVKNFVRNCFERGAVQTTYLARTKVLQQVLKVENIGKMKVLDCQALTLEAIIEKIISPIWPSSIRFEICDCSEKETKLGFSSLDLDLKQRKNVFNLPESIEVCTFCSEHILVCEKVNDIVFVRLKDLESISYDRIAQAISIQSEIFILGAIL